MKKFALISNQGTACAETVLSEKEFTPEFRERIEKQFCRGGEDDPLPDTWRDVTDNEAL